MGAGADLPPGSAVGAGWETVKQNGAEDMLGISCEVEGLDVELVPGHEN